MGKRVDVLDRINLALKSELYSAKNDALVAARKEISKLRRENEVFRAADYKALNEPDDLYNGNHGF